MLGLRLRVRVAKHHIATAKHMHYLSHSAGMSTRPQIHVNLGAPVLNEVLSSNWYIIVWALHFGAKPAIQFY